ncbi:M16 family metallopeptidase [Paradevosia shaoguanensis]|uniref:Insulinase family protein n=2 Tax=Paradevosia shaoguanensis TaxID=1335043 RepID=A0AA41UCB4_9HYPH|nr:pitrilysin family protein [Paradevosia shaoguanensis]KFL27653.1 peptidase M16 [Devosia sp. 17-2-E-8]MCF1741636.1 insulinase family protein [Paradevosia shaoguanensis]MCI0126119.1 insulinase family protein [Paradevosia shaoguanensis]CDP51612.1 Mitochondrial processing peptidase-like protein [Devosia sp. DBB001]
MRTTTLDNGVTVLTDDMPHLESASLGVWVKAGSRSERKDEHGISHLLEHMAFKGTNSRNALQIAEAIENVGGDLNAATSIEHTGYFARVLKEDVALAADILADILQNSMFDAGELDRERNVIIQEIGAARDNPDDHVFDLFQSAAFPDQPIGRTILGTADSVRAMGAPAIRDYMDRNYVGDRMVVAAAGNVNHDQLVDIANDRFHTLKANGAPAPERARYVGGEERLVSDHEQAHIVLGFEGRAYNSDGFYAAQVLASILGGGMSSRLFQEVREKRGLCYSVYAFHWAFEDSGVFGIAAATGEDEVTELVPVVLDELRRATETITEDEVIRVRNQIRAGLLMSLESPSARAGQLARQQILWGRTIPLQETVDRINRITAERVKHVASQIFATNEVSLAGIGPVAKLPDYISIGERLKH